MQLSGVIATTTTNAFFQMGGSANQKAAIIFY